MNPLHDAFAPLRIFAEAVNDLEISRIATNNRCKALTRDYGLPDTDVNVQRLQAVYSGLCELESWSVKVLEGVMKKEHPLGPLVLSMKGVGPKQGARLLGAIGDPYWNADQDRPRTVSELWAWCGYSVLPVEHEAGDNQHRTVDGQLRDPGHPSIVPQSRPAGVAQSRRKGQKANWSTEARKRAWLVARSCVQCGVRSLPGEDGPPSSQTRKATSPYAEVYLHGRDKYAEAVHLAACPQCGAKGRPAPVGSPLNEGHKAARAVRLVAKEVLKDLWRESKRLHDLPAAAQPYGDAHCVPDGGWQHTICPTPATAVSTPRVAAPGSGSTHVRLTTKG